MTWRNMIRGNLVEAQATRIVNGYLLVLMLVLAAYFVSPVAAQNKPQKPKILGISMGFDGLYKVGQWTPVEVTLLGGTDTTTGRVTITANDGDGVPATMPTVGGRPTQVLAGRQSTARAIIRLGAIETDLTVRYTYDGGRISRKFTTKTIGEPNSIPTPYDVTQELIVSVGPSIGLDEAAELSGDGYDSGTIAELSEISQLPTRWYGYDGVNYLVLSTSKPEIYRSLIPGDARHTALLQWVEMGGKVILCVGANAPDVLAADAPLADLIDGRFERMVTRQGFEAGEIGTTLESYSEKRSPLRGLALSDESQVDLSVPLIEDYTGVAILKQGDLPLVLRSAFGFGTVTLVTLDLDTAPFAGWESRGQVVNKLLRKPPELDIDDANAAGMMGYSSDLTALLRNGLEKFEGVKLVPFWIVALMVIGYILLIGPLDYFFVKKVLKRMELTWITFPLIVLTVSAGAYFLAFWLKGDQVRVNQVDVVDINLDSGLVRGSSWMNTFSPRVQSLNLGVTPILPGGGDDSKAERIVSWLGIPGVGLGGMSSQFGSSSLWSSGYAFSPQLDMMLGVPIQVWSTKAFTARWRAFEQGTMDASLEWSDDSLLVGEITSHIEGPLEDTILFASNRAYDLGTIEPDLPVLITPENTWRQLSTRINQEISETETEYNQFYGWVQDLSVPEAMLWMMFYDAAEVSNSTGWEPPMNHYHGFIDLSNLLETNHAILLCRTQREGVDFTDGEQILDGPQDRRWTYYRFVIPLSNASENDSSTTEARLPDDPASLNTN